MRKLRLAIRMAVLLVLGSYAAAQLLSFPMQTSVTGTEIIQNQVNPTSAFFNTLQIAQYIQGRNNTYTGTLDQFGSTTTAPTHLSTAQLTAPALTSCGTGTPAITGTDTAGIVTLGTSATGCVITFNRAYTGTPYCVVQWIATPLASQSYVTSSSAITLTQTSASGNAIQYICVGTAGG